MSTSIFVAYATRYGSTPDVAERAGARLRARGVDKLVAKPKASPLHGLGAHDDRDWDAIERWAESLGLGGPVATPLSTARDELLASHRAIHSLFDARTDEELFTKLYHPWTGTSLGAYLVSSTSSHYDWARKKVRKFRRLLGSERDA
jgi:hypothetical protein